VVLDNCEHLIDTVARLVDHLLASAPRLRVLATSRELLGVPGEVPYQLRSMEVPDEDVTVAGIAGFDAVRLFIARGEAASSGFRVTQANAATIVQLCRRLDGMPLALELAAARLRVLTPEQIAARLDDRFRLLTGGSRTALPRQQTLQAAIDWSYELLTEQERVLFDRLSAFQGGFTLEGAEAVCAGDPIDRDDILDLVSHLVDKSLVAAGAGTDGIRYRMLETIRQYGRERLASRGETEPVRRRHAVYFRSLVEEALPHLRGPDEEMWLDRLEVEHDNLRQALRWTIDAHQTDLGQGLAGTLYRFWVIRHHHVEGSEWLDQVLTLGTGAPATHGRALLGAGSLALNQGKAHAGRQHLEGAVKTLQEAGEQSLQLAALNNLGDALIDFGEHSSAARLYEEVLMVARATNNMMSVAFALMNLGFIEVVRGRHDEAAARIRDSVDTSREVGSRNLLSNVLTEATFGSIDLEDLDAAERYVEELVALGSTPMAPGGHLLLLGIVTGRRGRLDAGIELMQQGIVKVRTIPGYRQLSALMDRVFGEWAGLEFARGMPRRGVTLLAAAGALSQGNKRYPHLVPVYEEWMTAARQILAPDAFEQAWRHGASMTIDELIDFVLEEIAPDPSGPDRI
jgi:non-specific serine/threonine protein kinase